MQSQSFAFNECVPPLLIELLILLLLQLQFKYRRNQEKQVQRNGSSGKNTYTHSHKMKRRKFRLIWDMTWCHYCVCVFKLANASFSRMISGLLLAIDSEWTMIMMSMVIWLRRTSFWSVWPFNSNDKKHAQFVFDLIVAAKVHIFAQNVRDQIPCDLKDELFSSKSPLNLHCIPFDCVQCSPLKLHFVRPNRCEGSKKWACTRVQWISASAVIHGSAFYGNAFEFFVTSAIYCIHTQNTNANLHCITGVCEHKMERLEESATLKRIQQAHNGWLDVTILEEKLMFAIPMFQCCEYF